MWVILQVQHHKICLHLKITAADVIIKLAKHLHKADVIPEDMVPPFETTAYVPPLSPVAQEPTPKQVSAELPEVDMDESATVAMSSSPVLRNKGKSQADRFDSVKIIEKPTRTRKTSK